MKHQLQTCKFAGAYSGAVFKSSGVLGKHVIVIINIIGNFNMSSDLATPCDPGYWGLKILCTVLKTIEDSGVCMADVLDYHRVYGSLI